jgi:hypothetical protein
MGSPRHRRKQSSPSTICDLDSAVRAKMRAALAAIPVRGQTIVPEGRR